MSRRDTANREDGHRGGLGRLVERGHPLRLLAGRLPNRAEHGEVGSILRRARHLLGRVAAPADERAQAEVLPRFGHRGTVGGQVHAIGARCLDYFQPGVHQERRLRGSAQRQERARQLEELRGRKVLLAQLHRGYPDGERGERCGDCARQIGDRAAVGDQVDADHSGRKYQIRPVKGLEALP